MKLVLFLAFGSLVWPEIVASSGNYGGQSGGYRVQLCHVRVSKQQRVRSVDSAKMSTSCPEAVQNTTHFLRIGKDRVSKLVSTLHAVADLFDMYVEIKVESMRTKPRKFAPRGDPFWSHSSSRRCSSPLLSAFQRISNCLV